MKNIISIPALLLMFFTGITLSSCELFNTDTDQNIPVENLLKGTKWTLNAIDPNEKEPIFFELDENSHGSEYFILYFDSDSTFEGRAGCNTISSFYELLKNEKIIVGPLVSTGVSCAYTSTFQGGLREATSYDLSMDTLSIYFEEVEMDGNIVDGKLIFSEGLEYWDPWAED